jgi:translation elongation factor EF-4
LFTAARTAKDDDTACKQHVVTRCHSDNDTTLLLSLQVGYIVPGLKNVSAARIGDTWHLAKQQVTPLPGFRPAKPMVYAGKGRSRSARGVGVYCA